MFASEWATLINILAFLKKLAHLKAFRKQNLNYGTTTACTGYSVLCTIVNMPNRFVKVTLLTTHYAIHK